MQTSQDLIENTRAYVEAELAGDGSGHDWWHIHRVWKMAIRLAEAEGADRTVVELAALLHDIADWKFHDGDEARGAAKVRAFLEAQRVDEATTRHVLDIIAGLSYKGAGVATPMPTLEGRVVQDADRLDAIGAQGIARAFAYGGARNRLIYHPDEPPVMHQDFESYKRSRGHSINHFYEKLLLLKDRMNTGAARAVAGQRHRFMEQFLDRFFEEWDGRL